MDRFLVQPVLGKSTGTKNQYIGTGILLCKNPCGDQVQIIIIHHVDQHKQKCKENFDDIQA